MPDLRAICPHCGRHNEIRKEHIGRTTICEGCCKSFEVRPATTKTQPAAAPTSLSARTLAAQPQPTPADDSASAGRTMVAPAQKSTGEIRQAEEQVAVEWNVGDVILDLYEVKKINDELDFVQGGFGRVYRVHHRAWDVDLAVKSPLADKFATEEDKANFTAECETWINLGLHPHTVSCHYVRTLGGIPRVFAEYVEGGSLADWIKDGRLYEGGHEAALKRILDIAIQFAWGLDYAHEKGLVHQDVKPGNVMMTPDGIAKVTDFGLAKARALGASAATVERRAGQSMVVPGAGSYTPEYAAPEQLAGETLTRRADLYAWAVSVFEMFVGGLYWGSSRVVPGQLAQYPGVDADIPESVPVMPEEVKALLTECLAEDAAQRPGTMQAVVDGLLAIYRQSAGEDYLRQPPKPSDLLADGLNNRALSYLDLGKAAEAEAAWVQALAAHPGHVAATYNLGLTRWRAAKTTDVAVLEGLREAAAAEGDALADYAMGQIHLERLDIEAAKAAFEAAREKGGDGAADAERALADAQTLADSDVRCVWTFCRGNTNSVGSVCLSADGRWLILVEGNRLLSLIEVSTCRYLRTFEGHTRAVRSVCLSTDGRWMLSGSTDGTLRLWDVATGRCVRTFEGHKGSVESLSLSADGRRVLSGSTDETLKLWDVATERCVRTFEGHTRAVNSVCLSVDGRWALSGSSDETTVRHWDTATGRCVRTFEGLESVCLSADGRWALSAAGSKLHLWDVTTGQYLRTFEGHKDSVYSVCLSADSRWALSGSHDGLKLWNVFSGRCVRTFEDPTDWVYSVSISANGRWALSGNGTTIDLLELDGLVDDHRLPARPIFSRVRDAGEAEEAAERFAALMLHARTVLDAGSPDDALNLITEARELPGFRMARDVLDLKARISLACRRKAFSGGWCLRTFEGHRDSVRSVCLSVDGRWALSGSTDETLRLWDVATGRCLRTFEGHKGSVESLSLSADVRRVLSGSTDETLKLWDVTTGSCERTFKGHAASVVSVHLSVNGRCALSGSMYSLGHVANMLKFWELTLGHDRCAMKLKGHKWSVNSVCLSTNGCWALSGSYDKTLKLWDVATGRCLRTFEGHKGSVESVCLSGDGRWTVSGSDDGTLKLWELDWDYEFPGWSDWDEAARPYLVNFLTLHTPYANTLSSGREPTEEELVRALTRQGRPAWTDEDFQGLIVTLQHAGYGWLRPEGVKRELEKMAGARSGGGVARWLTNLFTKRGNSSSKESQ